MALGVRLCSCRCGGKRGAHWLEKVKVADFAIGFRLRWATSDGDVVRGRLRLRGVLPLNLNLCFKGWPYCSNLRALRAAYILTTPSLAGRAAVPKTYFFLDIVAHAMGERCKDCPPDPAAVTVYYDLMP